MMFFQSMEHLAEWSRSELCSIKFSRKSIAWFLHSESMGKPLEKLSEWLLLLFGAFFPILELLPHTTVWLVGLLFSVCFLWTLKSVADGGEVKLCRLELFLACFGLLLMLFGLVGAGKWQDGFLRGGLLLSAVWLMRLLADEPSRKERFLQALLLGGTACSCYGIWEYFAGRAELKWVDTGRFSDIGGRVCSFFDNPNVLAVYLLLLLVPALSRMALNDSKQRILSATCFATGSLCLLLTWSRGAWLAWLAATAFFLLFNSRKSRIAAAITFPLLLGLFFFGPQNIKHRFGSIADPRESSIRYRMETWRGCLRMLCAHPFGIGCGESAFRTVYPAYAERGTETVMHAHQLWLQVAIETGMVGLLLLLWIFVLFAAEGITLVRDTTADTRRERLGAVAAMIGCAVMGMFDYIWYHNSLFCLFWVVFLSVLQSP